MKLYHITVPGNPSDPEAAEKEAKRVHRLAIEAGMDASLSRGFGLDDSVIVVRSASDVAGIDQYGAVLVSDDKPADAEGGKDVGATQRKPNARRAGGDDPASEDAPNE